MSPGSETNIHSDENGHFLQRAWPVSGGLSFGLPITVPPNALSLAEDFQPCSPLVNCPCPLPSPLAPVLLFPALQKHLRHSGHLSMTPMFFPHRAVHTDQEVSTLCELGFFLSLKFQLYCQLLGEVFSDPQIKEAKPTHQPLSISS